MEDITKKGLDRAKEDMLLALVEMNCELIAKVRREGGCHSVPSDLIREIRENAQALRVI